MPLTLYYAEFSPPSRSVKLLIHDLGLPVEYKIVDVMQKEQYSPEFEKLNPLRTIPVIDDDGFILWESRAILTYLASKYAKDDSLYPKDLRKRAIVDQRLHYNNDIFYVGKEIHIALAFYNATSIREDQLKRVIAAQENIEKFLDGQLFIAGDSITVADYCYVTIVDIMEVYNPSEDKYPLTKAWFERCKSTIKDFEKINKTGSDELINRIKGKLQNTQK